MLGTVPRVGPPHEGPKGLTSFFTCVWDGWGRGPGQCGSQACGSPLGLPHVGWFCLARNVLSCCPPLPVPPFSLLGSQEDAEEG